MTLSDLRVAEYMVYTPTGFLTWDDMRACETITRTIDDAATFTLYDASVVRRRKGNACILRTDGRLLTLKELCF